MVNGITQEWLKIICHMDMEELFGQINLGLLMGNGKMEENMDIVELLDKMVLVIKWNLVKENI